jgi:hypothetical protein
MDSVTGTILVKDSFNGKIVDEIFIDLVEDDLSEKTKEIFAKYSQKLYTMTIICSVEAVDKVTDYLEINGGKRS